MGRRLRGSKDVFRVHGEIVSMAVSEKETVMAAGTNEGIVLIYGIVRGWCTRVDMKF
jgi:hypothetical protein